MQESSRREIHTNMHPDTCIATTTGQITARKEPSTPSCVIYVMRVID